MVPRIQRMSFLTWVLVTHVVLLVPQHVASLSSPRAVIRKLTLVDDQSNSVLSRGTEYRPLPEEEYDHEEDALEVLYPTLYQYFGLGENKKDDKIVRIRSTSFGCGKLGHQVWPSSLALSLLLCHRHPQKMSKKHVLELGSGCGLPSTVCRYLLDALQVTATDFWYPEGAAFDPDRLIPEFWHGINLQFNLDQYENNDQKEAMAQRLDWHDPETLKECLSNSGESIDLVIGSDLVYYPADLDPLWDTLMSLLSDYKVPQILLISPFVDETREALPAFMERLKSNAGKLYELNEQALTLYTSEDAFQEKRDGKQFAAFTLNNQEK